MEEIVSKELLVVIAAGEGGSCMKFSRIGKILINNQATCFIRNCVPDSVEYIHSVSKINNTPQVLPASPIAIGRWVGVSFRNGEL